MKRDLLSWLTSHKAAPNLHPRAAGSIEILIDPMSGVMLTVEDMGEVNFKRQSVGRGEEDDRIAMKVSGLTIPAIEQVVDWKRK